ncbi:MAG: hydroxypyruvate isomerase family protein [Chitinophagaceae bacterium]
MERRNFLKQNLIASGALLSTSVFANTKMSPIEESTFKLNYGFHDGMFKSHAGNDFIEQIKFAHSMGFRSIEDNGMMGRMPAMQEKIGNTLASLGMTMGVFVISFDNWPLSVSMTSGNKDWRKKFVDYCTEAVNVAKRCNAKHMTVVPGNYDRTKSLDMQLANVIGALRPGIEILEKHNLIMVLEPLSDTPELFLRYSDQTYAICKAMNSSACKILFDMYHMQRNEGNIIANIDKCWDEIGYFQIGDNPGRKEPGTGEMNYKNIFKHIYQKGYRGVMGMEHGNAGAGKEGELALIKAYREADSF